MYVRNDTGVIMSYDGQSYAVGETADVMPEVANGLVRCGWTIVEQPDTRWLPRKSGKRGLLLESVSPFKPLTDYLTDDLPKPTELFIYGANLDYYMACNDRIGDCTLAGVVHMAQIAAMLCNVDYVYPGDNAVENLYYNMTGGQDTGLTLTQVLTGLSTGDGLLGFKIVGVATVDIADFGLVERSLFNFGFLYNGLALPEVAESDFEQYLPWRLTTPPGQPIGGHCTVNNGTKNDLSVEVGANTRLLDTVTWASDTEMTQDFFQHYCQNAYVLLPEWYVTAGHDAVQHLDQAHMLADLQTITNAR
jgi:hypothetical protein